MKMKSLLLQIISVLKVITWIFLCVEILAAVVGMIFNLANPGKRGLSAVDFCHIFIIICITGAILVGLIHLKRHLSSAKMDRCH